jgi:predicted DNA-binding protein
MQRLKIALPDELRARLDAASDQSGESVAEEIRRRVEASFAREAVDEPTRELADDIVALAEDISRHKRFSWHSHEKARETLIEAIKEWLTPPPRIPRLLTQPVVVGATDLLWGGDDPATLGRSIARHRRHFKAEIEKSTEEMRKLHEEDKS